MKHNLGTFKRLMVEPVIFEIKKNDEIFGFGLRIFRRQGVMPMDNDVRWEIELLFGKSLVTLFWSHLGSPWSKDVLSYPIENGIRMLPPDFWGKYAEVRGLTKRQK